MRETKVKQCLNETDCKFDKTRSVLMMQVDLRLELRPDDSTDSSAFTLVF